MNEETLELCLHYVNSITPFDTSVKECPVYNKPCNGYHKSCEEYKTYINKEVGENDRQHY